MILRQNFPALTWHGRAGIDEESVALLEIPVGRPGSRSTTVAWLSLYACGAHEFPLYRQGYYQLSFLNCPGLVGCHVENSMIKDPQMPDRSPY